LGLLGGQRFGFTDWILGGEVWGGDHTEIKKKKEERRKKRHWRFVKARNGTFRWMLLSGIAPATKRHWLL
jgi:hypothetical protein